MSGQWSFGGAEEVAFNEEFAHYHGAKHGIFMANGTVTLQCALGALGIGPGDEVIVPALTWLATAMAVRYAGATPVFADIEPTTLCLNSAALEAAITERTRAVIPVHLYGGMADMEAILKIAARHDLKVIEDCAHAQGGKWNGRGVGSWGDIGSFSFQQSKTLSSGEGGICLTNDDALADRLYRSKHIGYGAATAQGRPSAGPPPGLICHNFRATEFQALILRDQLKALPELIETYNANAARIEARLAGSDGLRVQERGRLAGPQSYYGLVILCDEGPLSEVPQARILEAVHAEGLSLSGTYGSVYHHTLWNLPASDFRIADGGCPIADGIATTHALVLAHQWLGADEKTIEAIGDILVKVAANADELR